MNTTIKTKLLGGFTVILLLFITIVFFMLSRFNESNQSFTALVDSASQKVDLSYQLRESALRTSRLEKELILESEENRQELLRGRMRSSLQSTETELKELHGLVDAEGERILDVFQQRWEEYQMHVNRILTLSEREGALQALQVSQQGEPVREAALEELDRLVAKNRKDIETEQLSLEQAFGSAVSMAVGLLLGSILLAFLVSWWIIKGINLRITGIAEKAERIASREYTEKNLEKTIEDELEPIVHSLISINNSFKEVTENANQVASGNYKNKLRPRSKRDVLGMALRDMTLSLQRTTEENQRNTWLTTGLNRLNERLMGNQEIEEIADNTVSFLCEYLDAGIGALYLVNEEGQHMELKGRHALTASVELKEKIAPGEGLVGQAAQSKKQLCISEVPEAHLRVTSGAMNAQTYELLIMPFLFEGKVLGVLELGKISAFREQDREFLHASIENIALSMHSAEARNQIQELLRETQVQSEELQTQQEELRQMNEELEEQTQNLKQQQEELQMTNEELEEQTQSLEAKNKEVEAAKFDIEQKTKQLEISSKYKSEFLANMSHELRTPLNSLLILSKDLSENKKQNLDEDQVESAEIIYKSGHDLLMLINEVLDLSKVEAGKLSVNVEKVHLREFINNLLRVFRHQAQQKELEFKAELADGLPEFIQTDPHRLNQILKNLLSNAFKFTDEGSVILKVRPFGQDHLEFTVSDTGIGIKKEKQMAVFEAFQQADGGTARKYGGTGLGLSISRELAKLLGAEIRLESQPGQGSEFSVNLPLEIAISESAPMPEPERNLLPESNVGFLNYPSIEDDRHHIGEEDKLVLIIEDDLKFAKILKNQANQKAFKAITAATGEDGLVLADKYKPHAIILDIDLPGMNGRQVLAQIKANPTLRHIPVHVVSVNERSLEPIREGAVEYLMKPVDKDDLEKAFNRIENFVERKMKNLLIIEDDDNSRIAIKKLIGNGDVKCLEAGSGKEALAKFKEHPIDCVVLDIGLPDMSGFDLIQKLEKSNGQVPPIIIYTGRELNREENEELEKHADSIIIKGVKSEERLLDETALFLHRTIKNLPQAKQQIITGLYDKDSVFEEKRIAVVDDDMRNVFALSKVLKERGMEVLKADNGKSALELLEREPEVDLVLMDIMMPEMDGYEAMRRIRQQLKFRDLPIIALTAKAMKDDKQKCLDAGANDYIAKPVDVPRLLSLMQVWLSK